MNRYHLKIMPGNQPPFDIIVEADDMSSNSDGFYRFSNRIKENDSISYSQTTAYYPISRTIVSKIESNIAP
jgi:hypothetical protein